MLALRNLTPPDSLVGQIVTVQNEDLVEPLGQQPRAAQPGHAGSDHDNALPDAFRRPAGACKACEPHAAAPSAGDLASPDPSFRGTGEARYPVSRAAPTPSTTNDPSRSWRPACPAAASAASVASFTM